MQEWFEKANLWAKPIVRHDFDDSGEFDGNAYGKGGLRSLHAAPPNGRRDFLPRT